MSVQMLQISFSSLSVTVCLCSICRLDKQAPGTSDAARFGSRDQQNMLEEVPTYSTIDEMEQEVVVLSDNQAYGMHGHAHPSIVSVRSMQKDEVEAGGGSIVMEVATVK